MSDVEMSMTLDDPAKAAILGLKNRPIVNNPFYNANELDRNGRHKDAEKIYLELLNADFDNPVIHAALGMNYASQERNGIAAVLLQRSLEGMHNIVPGFARLGITPKVDNAKPLEGFIQTKKAEILNALGTCYKHENKIEEARDLFIRAQEGISLNADIQNNLGTLYINEGKPAKALEHMDLALTINPAHPQARWNKSLAHLELGDYPLGWSLYDAGIDAKVRAERTYTKRMLPMWDGSPDKNLIIYGEQGIGDEIMFASCLPDVIAKSKSVVFDCHKKLHTLFASTWPELDIFPTREDEMITWPVKPDGTDRYPFDARIAIGSLPRFFRHSVDSFPGTPYIHAPDNLIYKWKERLHALGTRPKIGISWIGGHKRTRIEVRSTPLESLLPILSQDATFVSLQYTQCEPELAAFKAKHGITIHNFPEVHKSPNYADTAALVASLDLVITVCTSIVHLAGSMGVATWVLTPSRPAWRYRLDLDYLPWYGKTVTLFRQQPDTVDWTPVIAEVASNLSDLLSGVNHGKTEQ